MDYLARFIKAADNTPITGLAPVWAHLTKVSDGTAYAPQPAIVEIGNGYYKFTLAPGEELVGRVDGGAALDAVDRYANVEIGPADAYLDAVKAKTDNLPALPAAVGSAMALTPTYDNQLSAIAAYVDTLETVIANVMTILNKLQFDADGHLQADATISAADIAAVAEGVRTKIPAAVIPVLQGAAFRDVAPTTTIVQVRQGETVSIPYDLGADYVGYTPWFGARLGVDSTAYAIAPRAARKITNRTGFIDLVPADLATLGNLSGELEIRKDSDPTQVLKPCSFILKVKKAVIR